MFKFIEQSLPVQILIQKIIYSQLMNFIPLTKAERKRMEQNRKEDQSLLKIKDVVTHSHLSPVLESDGATTDREKVPNLNQAKKEEILISSQPIQPNSIQMQNVIVSPITPQRSDNKKVEIEQFNNPTINVIVQNSPNSNLHQDQSNNFQIPFQNQEQRMSPKKSVKLKRDLTDVQQYAKPVEGFSFIQFIQSHYSPQENKQNYPNVEISQSSLQNVNGKEIKASKRALNNSLTYVNSESKSVGLLEPIQEKVADEGRKSFKRNLSPTNMLTQHSQHQKVNLLPLRMSEQQIPINHIIASLNVVAQPSEEKINDRLSQKLTRSLKPATVLSYHQTDEKVIVLSDAFLIPAKQKKQPIFIDLKESTLKEAIDGNRKVFLRRNLQNSSRYKPEAGCISQQISIDPVSNQFMSASKTSFLKRNLQGSNNFKPETEQILIAHVSNQMMEGSRTSSLKRNLQGSKNFKPEAEQILISHVSNQMMEGSNKSYLKRNLQNTNKQPLTVSKSHQICLDQVPQQVIEMRDTSKRYTRNLCRNVEPQPIPMQLEQIPTSHRIRNQEVLSERSNSSVITQGWNNEKQIFKIFRLQAGGRNRAASDKINANSNFIKRPLNSLLLQ